jgi:hypothetical protein
MVKNNRAGVNLTKRFQVDGVAGHHIHVIAFLSLLEHLGLSSRNGLPGFIFTMKWFSSCSIQQY